MGGRGAVDPETDRIPLDKRRYVQIGTANGLKVIEDPVAKNGKTPVMSNTPNTAYAVYSQKAGRIKHVFFYKNHVLKIAIDLDDAGPHWHKVFLNPDGTIGRKTHDKSNTFQLKPNQLKYIKGLYTWKKSKE